jgi:hypothetical protein
MTEPPGSNRLEELLGPLSGAERRELSRPIVRLGPVDQELLDPLVGWQYHVERFARELDTPESADDLVWNGDDWVGALVMRDAVEKALGQLSTASRHKVDAWLAGVDDSFRQMTEPLADPDSLRRHSVKEGVRPSDGWWWTRTPLRGPVKRDLDWRVEPQ